jgi:asparagine synthase (glutamine-hydrolysing)
MSDGGAAIDAEAVVRRMCDLQAYRGPDDSGVADLGRVCLGSRRLSIIDLSAAGHMPMSDASGRWWIAYNGEIYNFAAVREELQALGHDFRSHTDTEVLLHAWMQWGSDCLKRFVGMFAFAIHDTQTDEVTLVRDRYGKKPLYYSRAGAVTMFSSELKALVLGRSDLRIDQQALGEWFLYRNVDGLRPRTLIEGVHAVLPGQVVVIAPRGIQQCYYYSPMSHVSQVEYRSYEAAQPADVVQEVDEVLNEAVRARLVSDVPVGTLLSGGLDSSLVTAIAARHKKDLTAFHVSVEGYPRLDERPYAEQLAAQNGLRMVRLDLTGAEFRRALPFVTLLEDMPLTHPNSTAYYLISKVARSEGVPVLLSGEGADELFGGYSWNYRRRLRLARLAPLAKLFPKLVHSTLQLLAYAQVGMPVSEHRFRETLPPAVHLVDRYARDNWHERCEAAYEFVDDTTHRQVLGAMLTDISDFLAPLLRRLDRTSMGASVESRVPFLDHRLVHKAINLPLRYKVGTHADKWIVKQVALRYMPRGLVFRKKAGFPLPVGDYIAPLARTEFFAGGFCENALELGPRGIERTMTTWKTQVQGLFGLVALEMWGRIFVMGQSTDDVSALVDHCERLPA